MRSCPKCRQRYLGQSAPGSPVLEFNEPQTSGGSGTSPRIDPGCVVCPGAIVQPPTKSSAIGARGELDLALQRVISPRATHICIAIVAGRTRSLHSSI